MVRPSVVLTKQLFSFNKGIKNSQSLIDSTLGVSQTKFAASRTSVTTYGVDCCCVSGTERLKSGSVRGTDRGRGGERMQMRPDCFSSGWVELFGLSCCRLPFVRRPKHL